jgi:hypothetical protein
MATPAGFEPATLSLEDRSSWRTSGDGGKALANSQNRARTLQSIRTTEGHWKTLEDVLNLPLFFQ